jgi:hypothetical protein
MIPSMVALADRVVAVYGEFDAAMELCPANVSCATGLCKTGRNSWRMVAGRRLW